MSIPLLDERGLLPEGIHTAKLNELKSRFVISDYRQGLFDNMISFLQQEIKMNSIEFYIGGSFISDKLLPNDIEVTILASLDFIQTNQGQRVIQLGTPIEHARLKKKYDIDFYISFELEGYNDFTRFFQYVGEKTAHDKNIKAKDKRGIIKVTYDNLG